MDDPGRVPWQNELRQLNAQHPAKAEWMAPLEVINQVRLEYLAAVEWLHINARVYARWREAVNYFSGELLRWYQVAAQAFLETPSVFYAGVLRADHHVEVRYFSPDGSQCLIVDHQIHRRMATYDKERWARIHTQDMGDCTVVYRMQYDDEAQRWKISDFIQELPVGWDLLQAQGIVEVYTTLPAAGHREE